MTTSPIPAVIFQKNAPLYWKSAIPVNSKATPAAKAVGRIAVFVTEYHVVEPANQREVHYFGMCAVTQHPRAVVFVVDGTESARIGQQLVCDDSASVAVRSDRNSQNRR